MHRPALVALAVQTREAAGVLAEERVGEGDVGLGDLGAEEEGDAAGE
jgi:hypothetical protein